MVLGVRGKLFLTSFVLILAVGLASLLFLEQGLRRWLESRLADDLARYGETMQVAVTNAPSLSGIAQADSLADRLGKAAGVRVTIVRADGQLLGDSALDAEAVARMGSHAQRPEIAAARQGAPGRSHRYSTTLEQEMLFYALPFERPDVRGVVRVATPLAEADSVVARVRFVLLLGGLVGLAIAIFMSGLASLLASRALVSLVDQARAVMAGATPQRLPVGSRDELGVVAGSFNRLADELESALSALARERNRLQTILDNMDEAMIAIDGDDRVHRINAAALRLLGRSEPPVGRPAIELVRTPPFAELLAKLSSEGAASAEFTLPTQPPRQVLARGASLGDTPGAVIVMHDVTEMRRLENIRRDFVANVSHELRTPISIIRANAETLLDGAMNDPERGPGFAHSIVRSAQRLGSIVSDLLDLSRIEAGTLPMAIRALPLWEISEQVTDSLQSKARSKQIELTTSVSHGLDVMADEGALEQILVNLLDNAIKYTPQGGHVKLVARRAGERVQIEVQDDGPGIEKRHRDRIFERFYRVDPGRSREMGGTGLGLSIVKHLAESMAGSVEVLDNSPQGSVFRLSLPAD